MKCNNIINKYLEQQTITASVSLYLHLLFCKNCRNEIKTLYSILADAQSKLPYGEGKDMTGAIMQQVSSALKTYEKHVSYTHWLATGIVMFFSILSFPYSESFIWLQQFFGKSIELTFYVVMGTIITIYSGLFIGSHLEDARRIRMFLVRK